MAAELGFFGHAPYRWCHPFEGRSHLALPKIAKACESTELQEAINGHLQETKGHVQRLERIFELLGEYAREKECVAMKGLLREGDQIVNDFEKGSVRDAALIGGCQRV